MQRQGMREYRVYNECKPVRPHTPSLLQDEVHQQDTELYKLRNQSTDPRQLRRWRQLIGTHYVEVKPVPKSAPTPSFPLKHIFWKMIRFKYKDLIIFR